MTLVVKDRVQETSTTTGTGTYTLAGAVTGYQSFSAIGNANQTYYTATDGTNWEVGIGTYTSSGTTLSRDAILSSSNSGSAVNWAAGTRNIFVSWPSETSTVTWATTATAAGTTTLTNASAYFQFFTGTTTQTITLPVTSTLAQGWTFHIVNNSTGNLTVNSSGSNLVITVLPGTTAMVTCVLTTGTTAASWEAGFTDFSTATGTGDVVLATSPTLVTPVLGTPTSGNLSNCTADGTNSVGFLNIPQNAQTSNYGLLLADAGKHMYMAAAQAATTFTIPANGSIAYPLGTAITFINMSSNAMSIAITTDTMYLAGAGTTGTRTLGQYGHATAIKITTTSWIISGTVLS